MNTLNQAVESAKVKASLFGLAEIWKDGDEYFACAHGHGYETGEPYASVKSDGTVEVLTDEQLTMVRKNLAADRASRS